MPQHITASADTLMNQAPATTQVYLLKAIDYIDNEFGIGYAKANPALVGAFIQASATDLGCAIIAQQVRAGLESIMENMRSSPDIDLKSLTEAVESIAERL